MVHKLKIYCKDHPFVGSTIEVDGKEFPATAVDITGRVDNMWVAKIEFYVKEIEVDIDAKVLLKPLVNIYAPNVREMIYKELEKEFGEKES